METHKHIFTQERAGERENRGGGALSVVISFTFCCCCCCLNFFLLVSVNEPTDDTNYRAET